MVRTLMKIAFLGLGALFVFGGTSRYPADPNALLMVIAGYFVYLLFAALVVEDRLTARLKAIEKKLDQ